MGKRSVNRRQPRSTEYPLTRKKEPKEEFDLKPKNDGQLKLINAIGNFSVVCAIGGAGTGKTSSEFGLFLDNVRQTNESTDA